MKKYMQKIITVVTALGIMLFNAPSIIIPASADYTETKSISISGSSGRDWYYTDYPAYVITSSGTEFDNSYGAGDYEGWSSSAHISGTPGYSCEYNNNKIYITYPNLLDTETGTFTVYVTLSGSRNEPHGSQGWETVTITGTSNTISGSIKGWKHKLSTPSVRTETPTTNSVSIWGLSVTDAYTYDIQWGTTEQCRDGSKNTGSSMATITGLKPGTTYYIRARANANKTNQVSSDWSSPTRVITKSLTPLPTPTLDTLTCNDCTSIQVQYTTVDNATGYIIEYSTIDTFNNKKTVIIP